MTKENLASIKKHLEQKRQEAERIMDGGENYDGADGARYVLDLCSDMDELIAAVAPHVLTLPQV